VSGRPRAYDRALWALALLLVAGELSFGLGLSAVVVGVAVVSFLSLGVTHGALDLALFEHVEASGRRPRLAFLGAYVAATFVVVASWAVSPPLVFAAFCIASAWHFGRTDLGTRGTAAAAAARGALVVGLPLLLHPEAVGPTLEAMGVAGFAPSPLPRWGGAVALVAGALLTSARLAPGARGHEAMQTLVLTAMFVALHPLVAFSLYFGLWHAVAHLLDARRVLGADWPSLAHAGAPFAAAGVLAVVVAAASVGATGLEVMAGPALVAVSALTLPHVIVVGRALHPFGR
jgi:Brp/Blh family beta-carotene 15,15'-monooxygenase